MQLTKLTIARRFDWKAPGPDNPLEASVKISDNKSTVECVLSEDSMRKMLDLCAEEIAKAANERVSEFVAAVSQIEGDKAATMIEGTA